MTTTVAGLNPLIRVCCSSIQPQKSVPATGGASHFSTRVALAHVWLQAYLSSRKQRIEVNYEGSTEKISGRYISDLKEIKLGVPQSSVLGSILFSLYIYRYKQPFNKYKRDDDKYSSKGCK
jgi:hypothetical protein